MELLELMKMVYRDQNIVITLKADIHGEGGRYNYQKEYYRGKAGDTPIRYATYEVDTVLAMDDEMVIVL